jgi:hypothetical protein
LGTPLDEVVLVVAVVSDMDAYLEGLYAVLPRMGYLQEVGVVDNMVTALDRQPDAEEELKTVDSDESVQIVVEDNDLHCPA